MEALIFMFWACVFHIIAHAAVLVFPVLLSKQTEGTVLRINPFDGESFLLTVNYFVAGTYYRRRYLSVRGTDYLAVGDKVGIAYQPRHPRLSSVQGLGDQPILSEI